ncbi:MAG: zf-HC2 domain-containing protein [Planctomycetota bacterium]|nr:MAG: zf-HC2 domain-containing protein [Planctomycetota bacterium]
MFSCQRTIRLASEQLDHALRPWQRLNLNAHIMMCPACWRYMRQIRALEQVVREHYRGAGEAGPRLPAQVAERIKSALRQAKDTTCDGPETGT